MFTIITILTDNFSSYSAFLSPKAPSSYRMGQQVVLPLHNEREYFNSAYIHVTRKFLYD